jgi:hypothetical protein
MAVVNMVLLACAGVGFVAIVVYLVRSTRHGGSGPPILMSPLTRKRRQKVNESYARHDWPMPYDEDGRLLPASERRRGAGVTR